MENYSANIILIDAPTGSGKSRYIKKLGATVANTISSEQLVDVLLQVAQRKYSMDAAINILKDVQYIENMESLCGKEETQKMAAQFIQKLSESKLITLTGINFREKLPYFLSSLDEYKHFLYASKVETSRPADISPSVEKQSSGNYYLSPHQSLRIAAPVAVYGDFSLVDQMISKLHKDIVLISDMSIDKLLPLQIVIESIIMGNATDRVYSMLEVLPITIMCIPRETQSVSLLSLLTEKDSSEDKLLEITKCAFLARNQISEADFSFFVCGQTLAAAYKTQKYRLVEAIYAMGYQFLIDAVSNTEHPLYYASKTGDYLYAQAYLKGAYKARTLNFSADCCTMMGRQETFNTDPFALRLIKKLATIKPDEGWMTVAEAIVSLDDSNMIKLMLEYGLDKTCINSKGMPLVTGALSDEMKRLLS